MLYKILDAMLDVIPGRYLVTLACFVQLGRDCRVTAGDVVLLALYPAYCLATVVASCNSLATAGAYFSDPPKQPTELPWVRWWLGFRCLVLAPLQLPAHLYILWVRATQPLTRLAMLTHASAAREARLQCTVGLVCCIAISLACVRVVHRRATTDLDRRVRSMLLVDLGLWIFVVAYRLLADARGFGDVVSGRVA